MEKSKILVVYYSRGGNTRATGNEIAKKLDAEIEEIKDYSNRKGLIGFLKCGSESFRGKKPAIHPIEKNPGEYDIVLIGTPTWAGRMASPVLTYIDNNRMHFAKAAFWCNAASANNQKVIDQLENKSEKKAIASMILTDKLEPGEKEKKIDKFINEIKTNL